MRSILLETSTSASGNRCSAASITDTSTSNAESILAHSIPIAPLPTIAMLSGKTVKFKISSEFNTNSWSKPIPLSALGDEPVAAIIFLHSKTSPSASILFFVIIFASEFTVTTPEFFKVNSRFFLNFSTVFSFRSTTRAKSKESPSHFIPKSSLHFKSS